MLLISVILFLIGLFILWQASRRQKSLGLPIGRVIYTDTGQWGPVQAAFFDPDLGLAGRPDYIVEENEQIIPIEVKSSAISSSPYDSHIYQLASYCLLVDRNFGKRPEYGILHYPNRTFAIDYTQQLESSLLTLIEEIRLQDRRRDVSRSHDSPARCKGCGFQKICDQSLV